MIRSLFTGHPSTYTALAKEVVFLHGECAVTCLPTILSRAGMSVTKRELGQVSDQVVKMLSRVKKNLNCDSIEWSEAKAAERIKPQG